MKTVIKPIILASQSERRADILNQVGIAFEMIPSNFDETLVICEDPIEYVQTLALKKAEFVPCLKDDTRLVLAADTVVVIENEILGKPESEEGARNYLKKLSNKVHLVYTGVCVINPSDKSTIVDYAVTRVHMDQLDEHDIDEYIGTKEPFDKAGGYGIQGIGAKYINKIEGDYFNVVGLPINLVIKLLRKAQT